MVFSAWRTCRFSGAVVCIAVLAYSALVLPTGRRSCALGPWRSGGGAGRLSGKDMSRSAVRASWDTAVRA